MTSTSDFRLPIRLLMLALSLLLCSCASRQSLPSVPRDIGENGLLVARLYVVGMAAMENASLNVDGRYANSSLRDGYLVMSLPAGEHRLGELRAQGRLAYGDRIEGPHDKILVKTPAPIYYYVPGATQVIEYTTLGIDRKFRIESGAVTNLGLIVYLPVAEDPERKRAQAGSSREFRVSTLDNSSEILRFLETNYPETLTSLKTREVQLAPGRYLDAKAVPDLRRAIAYHERMSPQTINTPARQVVYGRAGTVAVVTARTSGPPTVEVLDTGTLADIVGATQHLNLYTFVTSDAQVLTWDGQSLTKSALPFKVHVVRLAKLGSNGLVAIDNRMRIITSRFSGDSWSINESLLTSAPRSDIQAASERDGVFVQLGNRGMPEAVYYLKAAAPAPVALGAPDSKVNAVSWGPNLLVARDAGAFVLFSPDRADFYFWSKSEQRWNLHTKPSIGCKQMRMSSDGRALSIECGSLTWRSDNSGATWTRPEA